MARSLSWLDRIVPISRTVQESARSHYDRKELQRLFELQPRAAQQLMAALPNISVGRARLVEREALSALLERLRDSGNPAQTFALMRAEGAKSAGRKLREFSLQDYPARVDAPPRMTTIGRGELRVKFRTSGGGGRGHAVPGHHDLDDFARLYEPPPELSQEDLETLKDSKAEAVLYRDWQPTERGLWTFVNLRTTIQAEALRARNV